MDRKRKFVVGLILATLMMTLSAAAVAPVSAYNVHPSTTSEWASRHVVQIDMYGYRDAWYLYIAPSYAADVVIHVARMHGMSIDRSKSSISGEIRGHAMAYMGGERSHSNPMDIEMYRASWWTYILD